MESESSGRPSETSFTRDARGWDDVMRHKEMTCGHNYQRSDTDSCDGERSDDKDVISSVEEECDTLESRVETPLNDMISDETAADTCFSPSHVSRSLVCLSPQRPLSFTCFKRRTASP